MSNEVDYAPRKYVGNGQTTEFQFNWKLFKDSEIIITFENIDTGEQTKPVLYTDYTVTISSYGGGSVIFNSAPPINTYIIIERDVSNYQGTKYSTSTGFQGSQLEKDFDRVSCNIQEIEYKISKNESILNAKNQFLEDYQVSPEYPRFCVNKGSMDFQGNPNFITFANNILTANADFTYTTGSGYTHEVYNDLSIDTSTYLDEAYNIFVDYTDFEYSLVLLNNTIYRQKGKPLNPQINDIWHNFDTSPTLAYIYTSSGWKQTELVPLGRIVLREMGNDTEITEPTSSTSPTSDIPAGDDIQPEEPPI